MQWGQIASQFLGDHRFCDSHNATLNTFACYSIILCWPLFEIHVPWTPKFWHGCKNLIWLKMWTSSQTIDEHVASYTLRRFFSATIFNNFTFCTCWWDVGPSAVIGACPSYRIAFIIYAISSTICNLKSWNVQNNE